MTFGLNLYSRKVQSYKEIEEKKPAFRELEEKSIKACIKAKVRRASYPREKTMKTARLSIVSKGCTSTVI